MKRFLTSVCFLAAVVLITACGSNEEGLSGSLINQETVAEGQPSTFTSIYATESGSNYTVYQKVTYRVGADGEKRIASCLEKACDSMGCTGWTACGTL